MRNFLSPYAGAKKDRHAKEDNSPDYSEFIWEKSSKGDHSCLDRYGITLGNARVSVYQDLNRIVVPLTDSIANNESELDIKSLHFIYENGKFRNNRLKGLLHIASAYDCCKDVVVIAEGFATARSIAEAMPDLYVVACVAACNIPHVTLRIRELLPDSKIIIARSNNETSKREPEKANQALDNDCQVIYPTPEFPEFNGIFRATGKDNLKDYFIQTLRKETIYVQR